MSATESHSEALVEILRRTFQRISTPENSLVIQSICVGDSNGQLITGIKTNVLVGAHKVFFVVRNDEIVAVPNTAVIWDAYLFPGKPIPETAVLASFVGSAKQTIISCADRWLRDEIKTHPQSPDGKMRAYQVNRAILKVVTPS